MASHELRVKPMLAEIRRLNDWVQACCDADQIGADVRFKMMLALEEAVANVINNAFGGIAPPHRITVRLDITADAVTAQVIDNGMAFDPTNAPDPDLELPLEERTPGGLGIHLMRRMVDDLSYRRRGATNILRLRKTRD